LILKMKRLFVVLAVVAFALSSAASQSAKIVSTAKSMVGKYPYSWAGGNNNGPTKGIVMSSDPYCDDTQVVGFDCSGLAKYSVYQGTNISMVHKAQLQHTNCPNILNYEDRKPGDLLFYGSDNTSITHVAIYVGDGQMVEAPGHYSNCTGKLMQQVAVRTSRLIATICRMWHDDPQPSSSSSSQAPASSSQVPASSSQVPTPSSQVPTSSSQGSTSTSQKSTSVGMNIIPSLFIVALTFIISLFY